MSWQTTIDTSMSPMSWSTIADTSDITIVYENTTHYWSNTITHIARNGTSEATISHTNNIASIQRLFRMMNCCEDGHSAKQTNAFCETFPMYFPTILKLPDQCEFSKTLQTILVTCYAIIIAVSLIGNSLVLLTFIFNRNMRSTTNIFIVSLAGSDMLLLVSTVPFNIGQVISIHWTFGRFACKLVPFMTTFSVGCSSLTLCCIALDRFYAIVFPFKLQVFQSRYKIAVILSAVWFLSALSGIPQATSYELIEFTSACETIQECLYPKYETHQQQFLRLWMSFGILFVFPLMVMAILYGIIIQRLWGKGAISFTANVYRSDSLRLRQKRRAIKMLVTVILVFVICWSPLQLFHIITDENHTKLSSEVNVVRVCLQCLAMSSGCYNPIVYAFMNEKFRKSFAGFLLCKKRHQRVYPVAERTQQNASRKVTQLKSESETLEKRIKGTAETTM